MDIDVKVETSFTRTPRVIMLEGMFDVPPNGTLRHEWKGVIPIEDKPWHIGLIVGPSGSGKTSIARQMFGEFHNAKWKAESVIDDFKKDLSIQEVADACSAVGFNTIPSWMKPYSVLSTGEQFRVQIARALLERSDPIVMDEFTSVVDRQVAHVGCNAVQKYIRKRDRKFIAVTCHYDVIEWLQPDWMLEPATMTFTWRELRRRPAINIEIARVDRSAWKMFAPFHYLTADLHVGAACYVLFADDVPASFAGVVHRPHPSVNDIKGVSRLVTIPDYQGLGLAMILADALGSCYRALGWRLHTYPAHPALVRSFDKSAHWKMLKKPGVYSSSIRGHKKVMTTLPKGSKMGGRPCAVFEYASTIEHTNQQARDLIGDAA